MPKSSTGKKAKSATTASGRVSAGKKRAPRPTWQRVVLGILAATVFLTSLAGVGLAFMLWYFGRDLPSADALRNYQPAQTTRVVDRQGALIAEIFSERRTVVPMSKIPRVLVLSVLAAEDADFYHHGGMDLPSLVRILFKAVVRGKATQGGSTITQQVVKNLLLTPERTLARKVRELILARKLEQELKKDEILFLYLNHINFGHGRYGVQEAARFYFGKDVSQLNLSEASLIAGIPQSPTYLSPRTHPEAARRRQMFVLSQLESKHDLYWEDLPRSEIEKAKLAEPALAPLSELAPRAPEVAQLAKQALIDAVGKEAADLGGYTVTTTLDLALEETARDALRSGLRDLDARHHNVAPLEGNLLPEKALKALTAESSWDHPHRKELKPGATYDAVVLGAADEAHLALSLEGVLARASISELGRFNPKGLPASEFAKPGVKLRASLSALPEGKPAEVRLALGAEGATILVDPRSREIRAMVGGYEVVQGFNRATQALRQPGSTFKPVVYAVGLKSRKFTPATQVLDAPGAYDKYKPGNYETWSYEGAVRLRHGLANSINSVAVRVMDELGPQAVVDFARQLGITTPLDPSLALALGASEVRLSELTNAYASFAAGGRYAPLTLVKRIVDAKGKLVKLPRPEPARDVLTPAEAFVTTSLMKSVVEEGTAVKAKSLGRPAAGKTGTSNQARDAWFVGFTTQLVAGVWVGYDDHRPLGTKESGAKSALPIWIELMKKAHDKAPVEDFPMPSGVAMARIDPASGKLAYDGQPNAVEEYFLEGTLPKETALPPDVVDPSTFMMEQLGSVAP
ncbi:MAG: PBP1A family penicillin-binding protein [Myxococcales bacterium]